MAGDLLSAFESDDEDMEHAARGERHMERVLIFEYEDTLFSVDLDSVDSIIEWQSPAPIPRSHPAIRGVIQDKHRIISVLQHPTGRAGTDEDGTRITVCATPFGLVGIPTERTLHLGPIELSSRLVTGVPVESSFGFLLHLDVSNILSQILGEGPESKA